MILSAVLNKSWGKHPTKQHLYGHVAPISQTIQLIQSRHTEAAWEERKNSFSTFYELLHMQTTVLADLKRYILQFCANTEPALEDISRTMADRNRCRESQKKSVCQHALIWRWCNGYRRRKWTRRHEFKSWTTLIAFHIALIPLGKVWIQ